MEETYRRLPPPSQFVPTGFESHQFRMPRSVFGLDQVPLEVVFFVKALSSDKSNDEKDVSMIGHRPSSWPRSDQGPKFCERSELARFP